ncbi:TetR/AcrR family transcriptional regulator [Sphingorhabdus arenilitoris]|uniref:TetR/AcrR family transcriptional regulator n=1 Tax=Sphingorhabdus arenilitoris TaxID=1490041 RepID=A0ABV8RH67_9SPHN
MDQLIANVVEDHLPPTRKGKATREKLLAAAAVIFGKLGYDAARISDIVKKAGISHGLFYRHFADKDAILLAVLERLNDGLRHTSGKAAGSADGDKRGITLELLEKRNILFFREYRENRLLLRVAREAAARNEDSGFREMWLKIRGRFTLRTQRLLDQLIQSGDIAAIPDTEMVAEGLSALTEQLAYVQIGLAAEDPDDAFVERLGKSCGLIWYRTIFGGAE